MGDVLFVDCRNTAMGLGISPMTGHPIIVFSPEIPQDAENGEKLDIKQLNSPMGAKLARIQEGVIIEISHPDHIKCLEGYLTRAKAMLLAQSKPAS